MIGVGAAVEVGVDGGLTSLAEQGILKWLSQWFHSFSKQSNKFSLKFERLTRKLH